MRSNASATSGRIGLPICERALVLAVAAGDRESRAGTSAEAGLGVRAHADAALGAPTAAGEAQRDPVPDVDRDPARREARPVGERDADVGTAIAVAARAVERGGAHPGEVGGDGEMARVGHASLQVRRLEQPRVVVAHRARPRDRGEVGHALRASAAAECLPERRED
jgi:hypothetical protein